MRKALSYVNWQITLAVALVAWPFFVFAQALSVPESATLPATGADWLALVIKGVVVPLLLLGGQWLWGAIERRRGGDALGRVMGLLDVVGQPIWDRQVAKVQLALADGVITEQERKALLAGIEAELPGLIAKDTLAAAMKALGVPDVGGLASWVLSKLLARWKGAHDPSDPSTPNAVQAVYPIRLPPEEPQAPEAGFAAPDVDATQAAVPNAYAGG